MLSFLYFILYLITISVICVFLLFVGLVIALKIWMEPVKGICKCTTKLNGKVAVVTGGNSGIGLETARELCRRGARVVLASRDTARSQRAAADITRTTGSKLVEYRHLDLSKFSSIRQFAEDFKRSYPRLDILVNNAGAVGLKQRLTEDGYDITTQINYLGPFLLTQLLLDKLTTSKPSRIVIVSSFGHRLCTYDSDDISGVKSVQNKSHYWSIYGRSKLSQVLWAKALAKKLPPGVTANALHPGLVKTNIFDRTPKCLLKILHTVIELLFKNPVEGAQTSIHLCVAPELENASGGYYSDCRPSQPARIVNDDKLVEKVWNDSLILTKTK